MPRQCAICKKTGMRVIRRIKLRGKFNPTAIRRQQPNLQWVKLPASQQGGSSGERVKACTKCIKALAKK